MRTLTKHHVVSFINQVENKISLSSSAASDDEEEKAAIAETNFGLKKKCKEVVRFVSSLYNQSANTTLTHTTQQWCQDEMFFSLLEQWLPFVEAAPSSSSLKEEEFNIEMTCELVGASLAHLEQPLLQLCNRKLGAKVGSHDNRLHVLVKNLAERW
eukprot:TRINITY_DN62946_c1_g1_i2.p2 TRINITY_DN62946_c1_g1~~TRINITY_DN62946_c1_g1_i2.p2  ORF type:complete len:174 (-),score=23.41 TRINITY_DN62946_c1_g1_i2:447-914(-)